MKAILLLFDSLKRDWIPPYGDAVIAPNFGRLAARTAVFDNFYVGSLPCMPARRELHTGRYNFLHRGWSPLEPFDDSVPEILRDAGIYSHLISDHYHYWEDGGAHFANRYTSYEQIRGQEGDAWKAVVGSKMVNTTSADEVPPFFANMLRQDTVNRSYMATEDRHCQTLLFDAGLEFIETNKDADNWFLHLEAFDPHEPFYTFDEYRNLYPSDYSGRHVDWPMPSPVDQEADYIAYVQNQYKALVSMVDRNLGRVLDAMDSNDMWKDTMLIVATDHGLLLGEHDWWSKSTMPVYNELANIPFFVWDPRCGVAGEHRKALAQNIDVAATLLEYFGQKLPPDMEGRPLVGAIRDDRPLHDCILFGYHGGSTNITDGRYLYMRGPVDPNNAPLYEYTLDSAHMRSRASVKELKDLTLAEPFAFTKGCKTLKIDQGAHGGFFGSMYRFGSRLYDLASDPGQTKPLDDPETELRLIRAMVVRMKANDAPPEQYERLGLREDMTTEDLAAQKRAFLESLSIDVLPELDWSLTAQNQFKTLVALLHNPGLVDLFGNYVVAKGIGRIEPKDVLTFATSILPKEQAGMLLFLLRLNGRLD